MNAKSIRRVCAWSLVAMSLVGCDAEQEKQPEEPSAPDLQGSTATGASASPEPIVPGGDPNPLGLPADISALLRREMAQLDQGMHRLHSALVMGRKEIAAREARQIHEGFILKQKLTAAQRKQLMNGVPEGFVEQDRTFHATASELATAVRAGKWPRALELYGTLTRACVDCHATHASRRFPDLPRP